jgi:tryptophan 2,3-dioxygenase
MGITVRDVTKEIIFALCLQYNDLHNIKTLQSLYTIKKKEKLFTLFKKINELWWKSCVEVMCTVRNKERFLMFFPTTSSLQQSKPARKIRF